jgi:3-phenylpropionate/trans-cinnamate dioxygenase ferredoxin reductase subunit
VYLREGRLIAIDAVNAPRDFVHSKALIAARMLVSADKLADSGTLLKDLATNG